MMKWQKTPIKTLHGTEPGIAPLVISASRATDIPAFHAKWLMNRIRAGYCLWENPYNTRQQQYISFERCKVFVFWSKNPQALLPWLSEIEDRGYMYYFQYTLNDYEQEGLEPRLPPLAKRIATFQKLSNRIGQERVIWRYDPIIMGSSLTVESILERIQRLAKELFPCTEKLVFSFLDLYKKTENNLKKVDPSFRPPTRDEALQLASGLVQISKNLPSPPKLATCAENIDLLPLGIEHNKCIDPDLLRRLCPANTEINKLYGNHAQGQGSLLAYHQSPNIHAVKDVGQRIPCGCAPSKDIGRYNTCMHLCAYCYANQSQNAVIKRMNTLDAKRERL